MLNISVGRPVVRFELLITVLIKIQVFDVTLCGWVNNDPCLGGCCCLHLLWVCRAGKWCSQLLTNISNCLLIDTISYPQRLLHLLFYVELFFFFGIIGSVIYFSLLYSRCCFWTGDGHEKQNMITFVLLSSTLCKWCLKVYIVFVDMFTAQCCCMNKTWIFVWFCIDGIDCLVTVAASLSFDHNSFGLL